MAKLQPDPGPAQPGQTVLLDGATWNAIRRMLAGVRGADGEIDVEEAADGAFVLSLAQKPLTNLYYFDSETGLMTGDFDVTNKEVV